MRFQRSKQYERCVRECDWSESGDKPAPSVTTIRLIRIFRRQTKRAPFYYVGFSPLKGLDVTRYLVPLSGSSRKTSLANKTIK